MEICFGITKGKFWTEFSACHASRFWFWDDNIVNINGFSSNLLCALILSRFVLGKLTAKFCKFLKELSALDMIMAGYYRFAFFIVQKR